MPDISWALLGFYCVFIYSLTSNPIFLSLPPTSIYSDVWLSLNNRWYCFVCACLIDNGSHYPSYFSVLPVMFNVIMAADDSTSPWWLCLDPGQDTSACGDTGRLWSCPAAATHCVSSGKDNLTCSLTPIFLDPPEPTKLACGFPKVSSQEGGDLRQAWNHASSSTVYTFYWVFPRHN